MDIGQFYEADERRRPSDELELGTEWRDSLGVRYELNWIQDTGELYTMREPAPPAWEGPFGGVHVNVGDSAPIDGMTVAVVAHIATREDLDRILEGWQAQMEKPDSAAWLADRLRAGGVADPAWAAPEPS